VAGATTDIFTRAALREIYRISGGIPRVINILCDRALLGAYTQELHQVPSALVRRAGAEVFGHEFLPAWLPAAAAGLAIAVVAGSALVLWRYAPARFFPALTHATHAPMTANASAANPHAAAPAAAAPATAAPAAAAPATAAPATAAPATAAVATTAVATTAATPTQAAPGAAAPGAAASPAASDHTLSRLLMTYRDSTGSDSAFQQLMSLWNARYVPGKIDGCSQALTQGLRCLVQRGSFAQLRLLNRPAILMLSDDNGTAYQVVLRGLHEDSAQLQIGAQSATVGISELARYWFGDFVLLWRPGTKDVRDLSEGMHGALVRHLREQLGRWRGGTDAGLASSDAYDGDLMQLVEQFQRANRLTVDGVAGIETQVALDAALATPDSPLLEPHATPAPTRGS
jgi:general secretion pathway protein A